MILTGKEDLRVQKTLTAIKSTFEKLICKKDYADITVKELAILAKINKKTFYAYYPTLAHLLAEMQEEMTAEFIEKVKGYRLPEEMETVIRIFFEYSASKGLAYERISCCPSYASIRNPMIDKVMSETWGKSPSFQKIPAKYQGLLLGYITGVSMDIYKKWVAEGKKMTLEEVILLTNTLLSKGVNGFLSLVNKQRSQK